MSHPGGPHGAEYWTDQLAEQAAEIAALRAHVEALEKERDEARRQRDNIIGLLAEACGNPALEGEEEFFGQLDVEYACERIEERDAERARADAAEAENARLRKIVEKAPHEFTCGSVLTDDPPFYPCDCFKSKAALAQEGKSNG